MKSELVIRRPDGEDGYPVYRLIRNCPPLDINSCYANLLQCSHFSGTSAVAYLDGEIAGFVSGYLVPGKPDVLFIWQVAVSPDARGKGLAVKMIMDILKRDCCGHVTFLHTTITKDNQPSRSLFKKISTNLNTSIQERPFFTKETHFSGQKETEFLFEIGPFDPVGKTLPEI